MMSVTDRTKFGFATDVPAIEANIRFYRGKSMKGTFCVGDRLVIRPVPLASIATGDVIVYQKTNSQGEIDETVHRVVEINENGLFTRGDNNLFRDIYPVQAEQIIGKVVMVEGKGRGPEVVGGARGLWKAKLWRLWLIADFWFRRLFRRPYHWLRLSKIIPKLWHLEINEVHLKTEHGPLVKYICKGHTIATWESSRKRFDCRKPFDLVIFPPEDSQ
jgi:signal peptidase I